jgi:hypothetical protein
VRGDLASDRHVPPVDHKCGWCKNVGNIEYLDMLKSDGCKDDFQMLYVEN